jgi:hypothetical protein
MATRDDLKAFVAGDLPARIAAVIVIPVTDSYSGQLRRINPADFEARVRYLSGIPVRRDTGLTRHRLVIEILSLGWDESEEDNLANIVEGAAEAVVNAYDGARDLFATGLPTRSIYRVRCVRPAPLSLEARRRRWAELTLEVEELEP